MLAFVSRARCSHPTGKFSRLGHLNRVGSESLRKTQISGMGHALHTAAPNVVTAVTKVTEIFRVTVVTAVATIHAQATKKQRVFSL